MKTVELTNKQMDNRAKTLNELRAELDSYKAIIKEIEKKYDVVQSEMVDEMIRRGVDVIDTGKNVISNKTVNRKVVDSDALKRDGLYDLYTKETSYTKFTVKEVG